MKLIYNRNDQNMDNYELSDFEVPRDVVKEKQLNTAIDFLTLTTTSTTSQSAIEEAGNVSHAIAMLRCSIR